MVADKLPLVVYRNGERVIIGEAELNEDGTVSATIDDEEMRKKLGVSDMSHFSIDESHLVDNNVLPFKRHNVFDQDKD